MLSIDTNLLLHAYSKDSPRHKAAYGWLLSIQHDDDIAISELMLAELYCLLRNPAVQKHPLPAAEAVEVIKTYRTHPRWRLIGFSAESRALHDALWKAARSSTFAFRKIYDTRTALSMLAQGVTKLATVNVKDFEGLGFEMVWNPLA